MSSLSDFLAEPRNIIVAGVIVVDELMELFRANLLKINERGIREGLILNSLKKLNLIPEEKRPPNFSGR